MARHLVISNQIKVAIVRGKFSVAAQPSAVCYRIYAPAPRLPHGIVI